MKWQTDHFSPSAFTPSRFCYGPSPLRGAKTHVSLWPITSSLFFEKLMPTRIARPLLFLLARSTHTVLARQIEYLHAENEVLRSKLPKSIRTTQAERNRLIKLGKPLGSTLKDLLSIVTYATFMGWINKAEGKRPEPKPTGRPPLHEDLLPQNIIV